MPCPAPLAQIPVHSAPRKQARTLAAGLLGLGLVLFTATKAHAAELVLKLFPTGEDCGFHVTKDILVKHELSCETSAGPLTLTATEGPDRRLINVVVVTGQPSALSEQAFDKLVDLALKVGELRDLEADGMDPLLDAIQ